MSLIVRPDMSVAIICKTVAPNCSKIVICVEHAFGHSYPPYEAKTYTLSKLQTYLFRYYRYLNMVADANSSITWG